MAFDAFLKLDGIFGDSTDAQHKDEIVVSSFSWGVSQTTSSSGGGGGGGKTGKVSFQDMHITSRIHKASPDIFLRCVTGKHINEALLTLRKAGERGLEFVKIKLTDVLVSSYLSAGDTGDDAPAEEISLNFAQIKYEYFPQGPDGKPGTPSTASWNL